MEKHLINQQSSLLDGLRRLNDLPGDNKTLVAVDAKGAMTGTLTDGDIRRALTAGASLDTPVADVMQRDYTAIVNGSNIPDVFKDARLKGIKMIPALNPDGTVARLYDMGRTRALLPLSAMIMAGGKGERLRPLTDSVPKPLLQIGGKAIIDYNVELMATYGIDDIRVAARHFADQLVDHFNHPVAGVNVKTVIEPKPLGTIGAVALVDDFANDDILVMNSDLLTTIALDDMLVKHRQQKAAITIAAIPYSVSVPYAILATDGERVERIEEKPTYSYYANAGIYIISRRAAELIVPGEKIDATDLIERAIAAGRKVTYFPLNATWIDVGTHADFRHAEEIIKYVKHLNN